MFGLHDRDRAQRWIAGAGWICIGAGSLWAGGCAGGSRDRIAAADAAAIQEAASGGGAPGRASLSDRPIADARSRGSRATVARAGNVQANAGRATLGARPPEVAQTVGQKYPLPATGPDVSLPEVEPETTVAAATPRSGVRMPAPRAKTAATVTPRPTVAQAQSNVATRKDRTISQVSAKSATELRRPKPPVITPAARDSDSEATSGDTGFERLRADRLMAQARKMLQNDFPEEALRLASIAEQLEKSRQALYGPGEERPSDLVSQIRRRMVSPDRASGGADEGAALVQRKVYKSLSVPAEPIPVGIKRGHIELTEIRSGWRSTESAAQGSGEVEPSSTVTDTSGLEVALALGGATGSTASSPATPVSELTAVPQAIDAAAEAAPAPPNDYPADDLAGTEPVSDLPTTVQAGWSKTSIIGLIAGVSGLFGLFFWRRRERMHYDALKQ